MSGPPMGREALAQAAKRLAAAGVEGALRDARWLLAYALKIAPDRLAGQIAEAVPPEALARFEAALKAREARQPVSQIIGRREFYGRPFQVTRDVLDPRPETETLIEIALAEPFASVLDLGTGSGAILLTLLAERPQAQGLGTDISQAALDVARANAAALGLSARASFRRADWFEGVEGAYDLIVANPPYIAADEMAGLAPELVWEPRQALTDEADGLAAIRRIAAAAMAFLTAKGRLVLEIGAAQGAAAAAILARAGFAGIARHADLSGRDRAVSARKP